MYIHTINNHTIKYEPQSLVVGDGVAYKWIFKPISNCKITGNLFADLRQSVTAVRKSTFTLIYTQTVVQLLFYASAACTATEALCLYPVHPSFCPMPSVFLSLFKNSERISMKVVWEVITKQPTKLNDYIFSEIGNWNRDKGANRLRQKIWIDVNWFCRDVKQVLPPSEWIHKFQSTH